MTELSQRFHDLECYAGIECGACLDPIRGQCSDAGKCEQVGPGDGRSCKVAGVVYADGESNIPDPTSCNTCSCTGGQLACTEIGGCDTPCPDGYAFGTDCASCSLGGDVCFVPEYDCFEQCVDTCSDPGAVCVGGLCVSGICGSP